MMMIAKPLFEVSALTDDGRMEPLTPRWVEQAAQAHKAAQCDDSTAVWIIRKPQLANQVVREVRPRPPSRLNTRTGWSRTQGSSISRR